MKVLALICGQTMISFKNREENRGDLPQCRLGGGGGVNTKERQLLYQNEAAMLS